MNWGRHELEVLQIALVAVALLLVAYMAATAGARRTSGGVLAAAVLISVGLYVLPLPGTLYSWTATGFNLSELGNRILWYSLALLLIVIGAFALGGRLRKK